jgi:hypothetical protein
MVLATLSLLPAFILILVVLFATLSFHYKAFASSPSFVRQEVKARQPDWVFYDVFNHGKNAKTFTQEHIANLTGSSIGTIRSVSYMSDGKTLNATFWLNWPFLNMTIPPPKNHVILYSMDVDVAPNNLTGWNGFDYRETVQWNNVTKKWQTTLYEMSDTVVRVLSQENYTESKYGKSGGYVFISLDLHELNYPSQYRVVFIAEDDLKHYLKHGYNTTKVSDLLDTVHVPTPKFIMFTLPKNVTLVPGTPKSIELGLKSNNSITTIEGVLPTVHFRSPSITGLNLTFGNKTTMSSDGFAISELNLYPQPTLQQTTHIVPIYADISFPAEFSHIKQFYTLKAQKGLSSSKSSLNQFGTLIPNPTATVTQSLYLSVTVEDLPEQLREWMGNWYNPISVVITGLVSAASLIVGMIYGKRNKT